ncbi:MAG TPA: phosphate/phosphite/phosphonate ABC transporter substrate-binding protein [Thermosynechococcaceae cyanobacterium]
MSVPLSKKLLSALVIISAIALPSCLKPQANPSQSTDATNPSQAAVLRISVLPTQNQAEQEKMIAPLEAHLEKVLGQPVDFLIASSYQDNVDMLLDGRANAAYTGAVSYFEALERGAKVEPIVAPIDQYTARPWYRACIIVAANSPIKTLEDLKGRRVAFVSASSTSGYLMPLAALKQLNIDPERDFAHLVFGRTHAKTEALLEEGAVDAIATNMPSYTKRQSLGKLTPQNSRVLWQSAPVPHSPFLVSTDLPPAVIEKLKEAFLTVPPGLQDIVGTQAAGYTLVQASDYQPMQQLRIQLNLAVEGSK